MSDGRTVGTNRQGGELLGFARRCGELAPGVRSMSISERGTLFTHTRGVDVMYARFYVKFHPNTGFTGHLVGLQAEASRRAGRRGTREEAGGDYRFFGRMEPTGGNEGQGFKPPGIWQFYCYWHR